MRLAEIFYVIKLINHSMKTGVKYKYMDGYKKKKTDSKTAEPNLKLITTIQIGVGGSYKANLI